MLTYIVFCVIQRAPAWRYFQLNATYFNEALGIYSKLDTDKLIPKRWRLTQVLDNGQITPTDYPVFVKPEWGQNSFGVQRANDAQELNALRAARDPNAANYMIQNAAKGTREFEIFVIPATVKRETDYQRLPAIMSITETLNHSDDPYPVNGIYNQHTSYHDLTSALSDEQISQLWSHLTQIGEFRLSRVGIRADSIEQLIDGDFEIIEINLLYPMPLMMLSNNNTWLDKFSFTMRAMWSLAAITKAIPASQPRKSIFFKKLTLAHQLKLSNKMSPPNERA